MVHEVESQHIDRGSFLTLLRDGGTWHGETSAVRTAVNVLQQATDPSGEILIDLGDVYSVLESDAMETLAITATWAVHNNAEAAAREVLARPNMRRALDAAPFIFFSVRGPKEGLIESAVQIADIAYSTFPNSECVIFSAREETWLTEDYCAIFVAIEVVR